MLAATNSESEAFSRMEHVKKQEQPILNHLGQAGIHDSLRTNMGPKSDTVPTNTNTPGGVYMSIHTRPPIISPRLDKLPPVERREEESLNSDSKVKHSEKEYPDAFASSPLKNPMYNNFSLHRHKDTDDTDFSINPDPVPYQPSTFMSSTVLKKVPIPRRHQDSFGNTDMLNPKRGIILHTDRYSWDTSRSLDGMSQRQRIEAEMDYIEKTRGMQRKREMIQHRAPLDLLMGGKKIDMEERFDLNREIQKLKSLVLPQHARELYHGKGFKLPPHHSSLKPRHDYNYDDEASPIPKMTESLNLDFEDRRRRKEKMPFSKAWKKEGNLPQINKHTSLIGGRPPTPTLLSKERQTVRKLQSRLKLDQQSPSAGVTRSKSSFIPRNNSIRQPVLIPKEKPKSVEPIKEVPVNRIKSPVIGSRVDPVEVKLPRADTEGKADKHRLEADSLEIKTVADAQFKRSPSPVKSPKKSPSPRKVITPNPLKGSDFKEVVPETEMEQLRQTFKKLDTDQDGHLMFNQLKPQLPKDLSSVQERFLKQVYDITSASTFFGVDEFMTMSYLVKTMDNLRGPVLDAFKTLDFTNLNQQIMKYVDLFQHTDRLQKGKIMIGSLQDILSSSGMDVQNSQNWKNINNDLCVNNMDYITKMEYLAHIPYFISQE